MNFLVDRCAGRRLTQWLQSQGHDALDARELGPDPGDRALLERAVSENRILITMDKDFGELIHLLLMGPNYQRDYMPDEDDAIVHYGPGDQPLCGSESMTAAYTDDPALVAGCADCLELAAEDLEEDNEHWANCLHCQQEISARNGIEWRRIARAPCPHCGKAGW